MQMEPRNFLCGGVTVPGLVKQVDLDIQGTNQNIELKIECISKATAKNIPPVLLDLLEVAAYVYCADQRTRRGGDTLANMGESWRRDMRFTIPVRELAIWNTQEVKDALIETLGFLSDDAYSFDFVSPTKAFTEVQGYFDFEDADFTPDEVALFSGGVDSFSGAVQDLIGNKKKMVLVGHHSANQVVNVQKELVEQLRQRGLKDEFLYIPVTIHNKGQQAAEYTQRARSFLFACLGMVVAKTYKKNAFTFYENGVVGLNLPITKDVMGGRATRTTHPKVIRGFERIFSAVLQEPITISTPYQWDTKKEVILKLQANGVPELLGLTNSCTRPRTWIGNIRHCGVCSQCVDRRFGVLAAGIEAHDDASKYGVDLLTGARNDDQEFTMGAGYVRFAQEFRALPKKNFITEFPEITAAAKHLPGLTPDAAVDKIYELYQRHSGDVMGVIQKGLVEHQEELAARTLPPSSILAMNFNQSKLEPAPVADTMAQVKSFMDNLQAPVLEFFVDEMNQSIIFKGGFALTGADYNLVLALLPNFRTGKRNNAEIAYVRAPDLADALSMQEPSMRQAIGRTRAKVQEQLTVDLGIPFGPDDFIENKDRAGYRLAPALREVAGVADFR
ncbi:MAG: hypothetical protein EBQ92_00945 [Proteobacteria bacterium]|nr:hypothetical protein [Pseudomonadota bacterium]